jgi:hypothetical protein
MHRVFTHLRLPTGPSTMAKSVFFENPDCPTLVEMSKQAKQQKICPNEPGGRARLFFSFFFFSFILLIELIQFNSVLTFLRRPRARRTRRLPESTSRSGRARSHGLTGPRGVRLCDPYVLARPRTISTDAPKKPKQARAGQVSKKIEKSNKSRKTKEKPFGPWPSLPSAVLFSAPFPEFRRPNRSHGWRRLAAPTARRGVLHMHGRLAQARSCSYRLGARTSVRPPSKAREVRWAEGRTLAQVCYCRRP